MDKNRKTLKEWGMVILIFAVCDLLTIITSFIGETGIFDTINEHTDEAVREFGSVMLIAMLAIMVIFFVIKIFLGAKGIMVSKNPTDATGHITLAKFIVVLNVIALISSVTGLGESGINVMNILEVVVSVAEVFITVLFIKAAKAVREDVVGSLRS